MPRFSSKIPGSILFSILSRALSQKWGYSFLAIALDLH